MLNIYCLIAVQILLGHFEAWFSERVRETPVVREWYFYDKERLRRDFIYNTFNAGNRIINFANASKYKAYADAVIFAIADIENNKIGKWNLVRE